MHIFFTIYKFVYKKTIHSYSVQEIMLHVKKIIQIDLKISTNIKIKYNYLDIFVFLWIKSNLK